MSLGRAGIAAGVAAGGAFALMVALQWAATWVPAERLARTLDDGAGRIDALAPRPDPGTAHRLRHHLQYMECEMAALALRGARTEFFGSRWLQAVFAPNPAGTQAGTLLPRCRYNGDGWRIVDHYGWRFIAPKREERRGTERWRAAMTETDRACPKEDPNDPYPRPFRWEADAECRAARLAETCARWLYPQECATYAQAPLSAKPYKPRYWWGSVTLYTLALATVQADTVRAVAQAAGWVLPAVLMAMVWRRERKAALLLAPIAPLAWWSQWDFGLWSVEVAAPQLWAWSSAAIAVAMASRRHATAWLVACGVVQSWLWLLDTAEALGFGLVALATYAVSRSRGEGPALRAAAGLAGAYAGGFFLGVLGGMAFRHVVYESTIGLAHPELSGYVVTNLVAQIGARGAEGGAFVVDGLGVAGIAYFLAWTWGELTGTGATAALLLHAGCWLVLAAHAGTYVWRGMRRMWGGGGRNELPWGGTLVVAVVIVVVAAEVAPWNDDWVRLGRAMILVPAAAWMAVAAQCTGRRVKISGA